jgi:hypothetical protein
LNTRLSKLYFDDDDYFLQQYNLQQIEPLSLSGMSGQVQYRIKNFLSEEKISKLEIPCSIFNIHVLGFIVGDRRQNVYER